MQPVAPDVAVGVELTVRADLDRWPRLAEGLLQATPWIHADDADLLDDLLGWIATRSGDKASFVQAAV